MRVMTLALLAAGLLAISGCTIPFAGEDNFFRGRSNSWTQGDPEYRAVDNAIYNVLAEQYGEDRVFDMAWPEKENHRWTVEFDEVMAGARGRWAINAAPRKDRGIWKPDVRVEFQIVTTDDGFNGISRDSHFGGSYLTTTRNHTLEAKIINEVKERVRKWKADGRPEPESIWQEKRNENKWSR